MRFVRSDVAIGRTGRALATSGLGLMLLTGTAAAEPFMGSGGTLCTQAIASVEHELNLPHHLLFSIGLVESGRRDPDTGRVEPWPWAMDAGGTGRSYDDERDVISTVAALGQSGVRSIDVGCLQVNLAWHPTAFASLDEAFDPYANARYAGLFLQQLFRQTGSWAAAVAAYHSRTPSLGSPYSDRVMAVWNPARAPLPRIEYSVSTAVPSDPITGAARSKLHVPGRTPAFAWQVAQDAASRRARDAAMLGPASEPTLYQPVTTAEGHSSGSQHPLEAGLTR
jgi:hypothetical protein